MKATVVAIHSASTFRDGEQRVTLKFQDADDGAYFNELRLPVKVLGLSGLGTGPHLDQEIIVLLEPAGQAKGRGK